MKARPCFNCGQTGHVKAYCPKLNKTAAAGMVESVDFGCVEVVLKDGHKPARPLCSGEWSQPRKPARATRRPLPSQVTMGDYLRPSVFVKAA